MYIFLTPLCYCIEEGSVTLFTIPVSSRVIVTAAFRTSKSKEKTLMLRKRIKKLLECLALFVRQFPEKSKYK